MNPLRRYIPRPPSPVTRDWIDAAIGGACLALFTVLLIFAAGVLQ
jgi:hypothetical protein